MAERVGFEPTVPFDITGFQDRLLKPLGHLSLNAAIITKTLSNVNGVAKLSLYENLACNLI